MRYYVIGDDGQKYGPADVETLNSWATEGRLAPTTILEDEASGTRMAASAVGGLNFPAPQAAPQPGPVSGPVSNPSSAAPGAPYTRPQTAGTYDDGSKDVTMAWVFTVLGLVVCCLFFIFEPLALVFANRAAGKGHPGTTAPKVVSILILVLYILAVVLWFALLRTVASLPHGRYR